jgi:hypothetical protein
LHGVPPFRPSPGAMLPARTCSSQRLRAYCINQTFACQSRSFSAINSSADPENDTEVNQSRTMHAAHAQQCQLRGLREKALERVSLGRRPTRLGMSCDPSRLQGGRGDE